MMQETSRTEYTWTLEEGETFPWVKSRGAHEGHEFTVTKIQLEHRSAGSSVICLHGPWLHGYTPEPRVDLPEARTDHLANGWEFLYNDDATDAGKIRELPLEVRDALGTAGLRIPLEVDGHGF